jgi:hypothetical protein
MDKSIRGLLILLAMGLMLVGTVFAATPSGATVSASDLGRLPSSGAGTVSMLSGNITNANLSTSMSTYRWAGLFGNASGSLRLADILGVNMYVWTGQARMVYACQAANPQWASLQDATGAEIIALPAFSFLTNGSDSYAATFNGAAENIQSGIFSTLTSDYATPLSSNSTPWRTYSLRDASSNVVFAGKALPSGRAYNGDIVDYEMLIPENGVGNNEASTTWNLFIELV